MALQQEIWIKDIQENLYANNTFLGSVGLDHSGFVNFKTVHVPQAGSRPAVVAGRSSFPATIAGRTDAEVTYSLTEYTTDPLLLPNIDTLQLSYDKRTSLLSNSISTLSDTIANKTLYAWAPLLANSVRTSGTAVATALAPSATGTRNGFALADLRSAIRILDKSNFNPNEERFLIVPADMYWQLMADSGISQYLQFGAETQISGKLPMLLGCKIVVRSSVVVYDTSGVIKATGDSGVPSSPAATDNYGALLISKSAASRALGDIKVFSQEDRPDYYGSIFSALVMHGASKLRTSGEGIVGIIQQ
jgi:hypothetical protein